MFNPANLAQEVFGILRSYDYVVNIFDQDGNTVYEPTEARRFFATPKNITVSIHEDGENSIVKMFLSNSTEISEVSGLISTMRVTASKFGVLFNVRKHERDLVPKDLAPNGATDIGAGVSLETPSVSGADAKELRFDQKVHNPSTDRLDSLKSNVVKLKSLLHQLGTTEKEEVKESMKISEAESDTVYLDIIGVDVEAQAWDNFVKGYLSFESLPDLDVTDDAAEQYAEKYSRANGVSIDHGTAVKAVEMERIIASIKTKTPKLADAFEKALDLFATGSAPRVITAVVNKALNARQYGENDGEFHDVPDAENAPKKPEDDLITVKDFAGRVERAAWKAFLDKKIELTGAVNLDIETGASANVPALKLQLIAEKTKAAGLGNLFSSFADAIESGKGTPFMDKVAKHAIAAVTSVEESLIVTESVQTLFNWMDGMTGDAIFESLGEPYDDSGEISDDQSQAEIRAEEEFSALEYVETVGDNDFNFLDDTFADEDRVVEYADLLTSITGFVEDMINGNLEIEDQEYYGSAAKDIALRKIDEVVEYLTSIGWMVGDNTSPEEITESDCGCDDLQECSCSDIADGEVEIGNEDIALSTEDILLPTRPDTDFSNEVIGNDDTDELDRIVALARGNRATYSPFTPKA